MLPETSLTDLALGVNIDHIATLRNVRGTTYPQPLNFALLAQASGADAITLHLREDKRHVHEADIYAISEAIAIRMNLEIAVTKEMVDFACDLKPADVCLVPERREELTTEGGLDVINNVHKITQAVERLGTAGIRVALFIDPDEVQIKTAAGTLAPVIEIHSGNYANAQGKAQTQALRTVQQCAVKALSLGLEVHAGHGLHLENTAPIAAIKEINELNIGHAIVARALEVGFSEAVGEFRSVMVRARN